MAEEKVTAMMPITDWSAMMDALSKAFGYRVLGVSSDIPGLLRKLANKEEVTNNE